MALCLIFVLISCGDEDGDTPINIVDPPTDTISPADVDNLRLDYPSPQSLAIIWTSPGDDGASGTAAAYDIHYSTTEITEANWDETTPVDPRIVTPPKPSGQIETIVVLGLSPGTEYFFALKTADEVPNWSGLSNCASGVTAGELIPPSDITDLVAKAVDNYSFSLTWTAPGDNGSVGRAASYDVRYSTDPIGSEEDWDTMTPVAVTPVPSEAGETESFIVHGLSYQTGYLFAVKTVDALGNWSGISNMAMAMAYGDIYWVFPRTVNRGELLYIIFETATSDSLKLTTNGGSVPRICGVGVIEELAATIFSDGVHVMTFDFTYLDSENYYQANYYWIALCQNGAPLWSVSVEFKN
jgi:hypothetical protein